MTIGDYLRLATAQLAQAGIESARLDVLILLEDALDRDKASILANPDMDIPTETLTTLNTQIVQRMAHLPLAYIRGSWAFYGRNYKVTEDVLVPRPETEDMITLLKNLPLPSKPVLADVGTGSGCLAITAALELPGSRIDASDISPSAIAVAEHNNTLHRTHVQFMVRDLLRDVSTPYDVVLANLPYVPNNYAINKAAGLEPSIALFAGP
ncbi:MAG TPA: HemK/PrmC family methyltransferase, partial [Candidatus Saccharimonadales bacterium]|nr:HemK/PrmC family methyltransferase [Candidatus Saccharimonadales bacterium]